MNKALVHRIVQDVEKSCGPLCLCGSLDVHGLSHLRRVAVTAGRLAAILGQDIETVAVAAFLHDCARRDDADGTTHARESARLAGEILTRYYPHMDREHLCDGIARHADGTTTRDLLIGCIWDADRLDLTRLGLIVDRRLLSTSVARRIAAIRSCSRIRGAGSNQTLIT